MKDAIELLLRFGYHLLFVALQFICFYIIINYNKEQKSIFLNSTSLFTSAINDKVDKFEKYLNLELENDSLKRQNAKLIKKFIDYDINSSLNENDTIEIDSAKYLIQGVNVCNSTFHLRDNYITLCEGSKQGIKEDDGVISQNGIVGIVKKVSENRSIVMSVLHSQTTISCSILRHQKSGKNSSGILKWKSNDPKICNLEAIPKHLAVLQNDTVVTSGYSSIFPKSVFVGKVKSVTLEKGNNTYTIEVELFNDPSAWDAIYIVRNKFGDEQRSLENSVKTNE
jgi:rod shape-determining protein MreC